MPSKSINKQITKTNEGQYQLRSEQDAYNDSAYRYGLDATIAKSFGYGKTQEVYDREEDYQEMCLERFLNVNEESEYAKKDEEKIRAYYSLSKSSNHEMSEFASDHTNRKGFRRRSKIDTAAKKIEKSKTMIRKANVNPEINMEHPHVYAMAKMEALDIRLSAMRYAAEAKGYNELDEMRRKNLAEIKIKGAQLALIRDVENEYKIYLRKKAKDQAYSGPDTEKKFIKVYKELLGKKESIQEEYNKNKKDYEFNTTKYLLENKNRTDEQNNATDEEIRDLLTLSENGQVKYLHVQAHVERLADKHIGTSRDSLALIRVARAGESQEEIIADACKYHMMYDTAKTEEEYNEMQRLLQKHIDSLIAGLPTPEQIKADPFKWIMNHGEAYNLFISSAGLDDNSTKDTVWGKKIFATEKGMAQKELVEKFGDLYGSVIKSRGIVSAGGLSSFGDTAFSFGALDAADMEEYKEMIPEAIKTYEAVYNSYMNRYE